MQYKSTMHGLYRTIETDYCRSNKMADLPRATDKEVKKIDSKLQCSICNDEFQEPKLLSCFHIFCQPCLEKLVTENEDTLICPTCHHLVILPEDGVGALPKDFNTEHLFEFRSTLKRVRKTHCEKCKKLQATGYCCECSKFICNNCSEMHKMWDELADHKIVPMQEVNIDTIVLAPSKQTPKCDKHPSKKLEFYCNSCAELICTICSISHHKGHSFELLENAYVQHKEDIVLRLKPVKEKLNEIKEAMAVFEERATEISKQKGTVEAHINKEIEELHKSLDQRREQLLQMLKTRTQSKLKELTAHKEIVKILQVQMSTCIEYTEAGLENGTENEVLSMKDTILKRVAEVSCMFDQTTIQPQIKADIKLVPDGKEKFQQTCKEMEEKVHIGGDTLKQSAKPPVTSKPTKLKRVSSTTCNQRKPLLLAGKNLKPDSLQSSDALRKSETALNEKLQHTQAIQFHMASRRTEFKENRSLLEYLQNEGQSLETPRLLKIAADIADIMACLEEHGYIHRDLALRNVLISQGHLCVIGKFIQIGEGGTYEASTAEKMAIKWTAPEAMFQNRFTIKSDVWSFGVMLYELITCGRTPYPGMTNAQVVEGLKDGYRLSRPVCCPEELYKIMVSCWNEAPRQRPTFETLQWQLEEFFESKDEYEMMVPSQMPLSKTKSLHSLHS